MGWWSMERNAKEVIVGDGPLDVLLTALRKIARQYRKDFKRNPTDEEWSELLESSIRGLEDELFDDMEERELESVVVKLRPRPKRPRPQPGDYFAIPLPSGGYGYGRIIKITQRVLLWMRLVDVRSETVLQLDEIRGGRAILDMETRTSWIGSMKWPIVGHVPLTDDEQAALADEPHWISSYADWSVERIAEWKLSGKRGLPPECGCPHDGYVDL